METPKIINNHSLFSPFKMIGICKFFIVHWKGNLQINGETINVY